MIATKRFWQYILIPLLTLVCSLLIIILQHYKYNGSLNKNFWQKSFKKILIFCPAAKKCQEQQISNDTIQPT